MMGYFKPSRRKIGVVTLALACVFAAGWVRSVSLPDNTDYLSRTFNYTREFLFSTQGSFGYVRETDPDRKVVNVAPHWGATTFCVAGVGGKITLRWQALGFHRMESTKDLVLAAPYWSIVLPLTLLSAWLILPKPRAKAETPITPANENA